MKLGDKALDFALPGVDGRTWSLSDFADKPVLVVVQMCNHCPYVVAYQDRMNALASELVASGVAFVGINSNDPAKYAADDFAHMTLRAKEAGIPFPYLHDASQDVARAYGALRTPEFFVFDASRKLVYTGSLDDNMEEPDKVESEYLRDAIDAALAGKAPAVAETQAVGCTVKWK